MVLDNIEIVLVIQICLMWSYLYETNIVTKYYTEANVFYSICQARLTKVINIVSGKSFLPLSY